MANNKRSSGGDWSWTLIIAMFLFGLWFIALPLLFVKLFGNDEKTQTQQPPPLRSTAGTFSGQTAARGSRPVVPASAPRAAKPNHAKVKKAAKRITKAPKIKKSNAWLLKFLGAVLLVIGLLGLDGAFNSVFFFYADDVELFRWAISDLFRWGAVTIAGGGMLCNGLSMSRQIKRFSKYLLVMGDREAMPVDELARALGYSQRRVIKDLKKMIDKGYFGGKAYLNLELGYLFRTSGADAAFRQKMEDAVQQQTQAGPPPKETEEGYSGILRSIRRTNDRIADPVLSAKITRLEEITSKIFKIVEEDPKKAAKIDTFLNYYLPTTQKLLNSYAQFEAAGVEGENLRQAKQRIESTMDSIVSGFEHQLDELYQADALDVDTDIRVMEHMLRRDTGSAAQDFNLEK